MKRRDFICSGMAAVSVAGVAPMSLSVAAVTNPGYSRLSRQEARNLGISPYTQVVLGADGFGVPLDIEPRIVRRYQEVVYVWFDTLPEIHQYDQHGQLSGKVSLPEQVTALNDFAVDSENNIYLLPRGHHQIVQLDSRGLVLNVLGEFGTSLSHHLNGPTSLTLDRENRIHVLNTGSRTIKVFNAKGQPEHEYGQSRWLKDRQFHEIDGLEEIRVTGGTHRDNAWYFSSHGMFLSAV
ncbi:hypothetical protein [Motilimonas sp. KMU-193]|uniref:hypothetical protein n=1 Tax=Motilimonas sp. KMU-193 TaxID=3388668 RepID=UPI00396B0774